MFLNSKSKMKRSREAGVIIKADEANGAVISFNGREYYIYNKDIVSLMSNSDYQCTIVHNKFHQAMLDIENTRNGNTILRQEVNPLKYKNIPEWVKDE